MSDEETFDCNDDGTEEEDELLDWQLPLCFMKKRHKEKIEGSNSLPQTWRMKERVSQLFLPICIIIQPCFFYI